MGGKLLGGRSVDLGLATKLSAMFVELLENSKLVRKVKVTGSVRRQVTAKLVNDIDIVLIPKEGFDGWLRGKFPEMVGGNEKASILYQGVQIDLLYTNEKQWGAAILHFTGPKERNIGMRSKAKKMGFKLSEKGLFKSDGTLIASETEEDIFALLGMPFKAPHQR